MMFMSRTDQLLLAAGKKLMRMLFRNSKHKIRELKIRSVLTCKARYGVCAKCYGRNLATGKIVDIGESVGILPPNQSAKPGTQLTMRTFHTGGIRIAGKLPKVSHE